MQEAIDILAPKDGVIQDLYASIKRRANLSDEAADRLRIYECNGCRISRELPANAVLVGVPDYSTLYAELIPEEERNANEEDWTIFAFHFDKEPNKTHGIPFKFVIKPVSAGVLA